MAVQTRTSEHYTYSDYCQWPQDEHWELIDGVAYNMSPAPASGCGRWAVPTDRDSRSVYGLVLNRRYYPRIAFYTLTCRLVDIKSV